MKVAGEAQRSSVYVPLKGGWSSGVRPRRAYPMLVGRDIEVDCRRRLGVRSFSSSLPPTPVSARRSSATSATDLVTVLRAGFGR